MTVTPILCHRFLKMPTPSDVDEGKPAQPNLSDRLFRRMAGSYEGLLRRILRFRKSFLLLMLVAFVLRASAECILEDHLPANWYL